jgi:hypothetical protein
VRKRIIALFVPLLFAPIMACADTTGALNGIVSDSASGVPLANVTVVVNSPREREQAKTDQRGRYVFLDLQPGAYAITAVGAGYEPYSAGVTVRPGSEASVKIALVKMLKTAVVDCFCPKLLMQLGVVADEYRVRRSNAPSFDLLDSAFPLLFTVPGITFGSAPGMMR